MINNWHHYLLSVIIITIIIFFLLFFITKKKESYTNSNIVTSILVLDNKTINQLKSLQNEDCVKETQRLLLSKYSDLKKKTQFISSNSIEDSNSKIKKILSNNKKYILIGTNSFFTIPGMNFVLKFM